MEFITENYLWILLIIIVVLMAVVGYVAEKKDFIKKGVKVEKPKKEKVEETPIVIEDKGIDELLKNAVDNDSKKDKKKNKKEEVVLEPVMEPINEVNSDIDVNAMNDDLMSPLVSEPVNEDNAVDESLFAPLETTEAASELNPIEVSALPEEEPAVVNAEEDIWKF